MSALPSGSLGMQPHMRFEVETTVVVEVGSSAGTENAGDKVSIISRGDRHIISEEKDDGYETIITLNPAEAPMDPDSVQMESTLSQYYDSEVSQKAGEERTEVIDEQVCDEVSKRHLEILTNNFDGITTAQHEKKSQVQTTLNRIRHSESHWAVLLAALHDDLPSAESKIAQSGGTVSELMKALGRPDLGEITTTRERADTEPAEQHDGDARNVGDESRARLTAYLALRNR